MIATRSLPLIPIEHYHELNASYGEPFLFHLTNRGFFSEINNLLNAILYGLFHRRRLAVGEDHFRGLWWSDFFSTALPAERSGDRGRIPGAWQIHGVRTHAFQTLRRFVDERHTTGAPLALPDLGLEAPVFTLKQLLAQSFCTPIGHGGDDHQAAAIAAVLVANDLAHEPFAACHVRRGDKSEGYLRTFGKRVVEGEHTPMATYVERIGALAPELRTLFVLTDDHAVIEEAIRESAGHGLRVVYLCPPTRAGYSNRYFARTSREEKVEQLLEMLQEVWIASGSQLFLGGFKSNLGRFVVLTHRQPQLCHSIDAQRSWDPL